MSCDTRLGAGLERITHASVTQRAYNSADQFYNLTVRRYIASQERSS